MTYTVPLGDAANFVLEEYTVPQGDVANFQLEDDIPTPSGALIKIKLNNTFIDKSIKIKTNEGFIA